MHACMPENSLPVFALFVCERMPPFTSKLARRGKNGFDVGEEERSAVLLRSQGSHEMKMRAQLMSDGSKTVFLSKAKTQSSFIYCEQQKKPKTIS